MDYSERALADIKKLDHAIEVAKRHFSKSKSIEWAENYLKDARHFFNKGDFFSAFGCANYAYGIIDSLFIEKGIKEKIYEEEKV